VGTQGAVVPKGRAEPGYFSQSRAPDGFAVSRASSSAIPAPRRVLLHRFARVWNSPRTSVTQARTGSEKWSDRSLGRRDMGSGDSASWNRLVKWPARHDERYRRGRCLLEPRPTAGPARPDKRLKATGGGGPGDVIKMPSRWRARQSCFGLDSDLVQIFTVAPFVSCWARWLGVGTKYSARPDQTASRLSYGWTQHHRPSKSGGPASLTTPSWTYRVTTHKELSLGTFTQWGTDRATVIQGINPFRIDLKRRWRHRGLRLTDQIDEPMILPVDCFNV